MDSTFIVGGATPSSSSSFLSQIFSTSPESMSEIYNSVQFAILALIPIFILNKIVAKVIPEPNIESSSLIILGEILLQVFIVSVGVILIYRFVTYFPSFSGFKYETLSLAGPTMFFIILLFSIQSKLGIKANIIADRLYEIWNGPQEDNKKNIRKNVRTMSPVSPMMHTPSQADFLDNSVINTSMSSLPNPISTKNVSSPSLSHQNNVGFGMRSSGPESRGMDTYMGPAAANSMIGGSFGTRF
jgi:hypothetical protein